MCGNLLIKMPNAYYFSGTSSTSYFTFTPPHDFSTEVAGGWSVWLKNQVVPQGSNVKIFNPGTNRLDLNLEATTGKLFVWFHDSDNTGHLVWKSSVNNVDGEWHNIITNKTNTKITVYFDGSEVNSVSTTKTTYDEDSPGRLPVGTWRGWLSDLKIFNNGLSDIDIERVSSDKFYVPDETVLWYNVNALEDGSLNDRVGSNDATMYSPITLTYEDSINCWASRFDIDNYNITVETQLTPGQRNDLFNHVTPGAVRELYNILGTPYFIDSTYSSGNTLIFSPSGNLSDIVNEYKIAVKSISDTPIGAGNKLFNVKIEGTRIDLE